MREKPAGMGLVEMEEAGEAARFGWASARRGALPGRACSP